MEKKRPPDFTEEKYSRLDEWVSRNGFVLLISGLCPGVGPGVEALLDEGQCGILVDRENDRDSFFLFKSLDEANGWLRGLHDGPHFKWTSNEGSGLPKWQSSAKRDVLDVEHCDFCGRAEAKPHIIYYDRDYCGDCYAKVLRGGRRVLHLTKEMTSAELTERLYKLVKNAGPGDMVLTHYQGPGVQVGIQTRPGEKR